MKLQLRSVAFKSAHLHYASLFKEIESKDVVADLAGVLDLTRQ